MKTLAFLMKNQLFLNLQSSELLVLYRQYVGKVPARTDKVSMSSNILLNLFRLDLISLKVLSDKFALRQSSFLSTKEC